MVNAARPGIDSGPHRVDAVQVNMEAWDTRTAVHAQSAFYDVEGVLAGQDTLHHVELGLAGDVNDIRLVHLQCHLGLDSISWARRGADVLGVDFSSAALEVANSTAASVVENEPNLRIRFLRSDVHALPDTMSSTADLVVASYGILPWLHDLDAWATSIATVLVPDGRIILVDFHPILEAVHVGSFSGTGTYLTTDQPVVTATRGTYADSDSDIEYKEVRFQHGVGSVVSALLQAGLVLQHFAEYTTSPYRIIDELTEQDADGWHAAVPTYPVLFSLAFTKPGAQG